MTSGPDTIALRAYTQKPGSKPLAQRKRGAALDEPSPFVLVFDTETRTDPSQALRIGFYQVRKSGALIEEGAFYPPDLPDDELADLRNYCEPHGIRVRALADFNEYVFLKYGYDLSGTITGFNLPFDISRIAIEHGESRGRRNPKTGNMEGLRGGFSFTLVPSRNRPRVKIKHLSRRASLTQFSAFWDQPTPRGMRKRGLKVDHHKGHFVDVKTLSAALTARGHTLESLCAALDVPTRKTASEAHGGPLTVEYLDYARADVQASWECYAALMALYGQHGLATPAHKIISEASIGKAYLDEMGIRPLMACQDVPGEMLGQIMATFYGGRAEVRLRRVVTEVRYTDFKSMYPTVNALMGLWAFVIANGFTSSDTTEVTRAFLASVTRDDFQNHETWRQLTTLVQIRPDGDLVPIRAKYDDNANANNTIGLNYLSFRGGIWYTLADVIAAKALTGKAPHIIKAISYYPGKPQSGLKAIRLFGKPEYPIDPLECDAFTRLIDLRDEAKAAKDPNELAIKILANSTSYGIYIEVQRDNAPKKEPLEVFGPDGFAGELQSTALEDPGRFFHPLLGTLITGAARLMLALAEREALAQGLGWAFCDTDSLAIARPEGMARDEFEMRVKRVLAWFEPLNPYRKPGSILQMEDVNYAANGNGELEPLYAFAISAKRYALFNIDTEGRPVIRKASAHGLGHLRPPYPETDPAPGVPDPVAPWSKLGVTRWQYDYWYFALSAALAGRPERVRLDYHPTLSKPAAQRYGATSPRLLKWMDAYNAHKSYPDQIKPFGFMVSFTALPATQRPMPEDLRADPMKRGRPPAEGTPLPVAPFETDPALAAMQAFDRETGEPVPVAELKTYTDALATYHLSPENKFENGDRWDTGETRRRHVQAEHVILIGKEANGVGEYGEAENPAELAQIALEIGGAGK